MPVWGPTSSMKAVQKLPSNFTGFECGGKEKMNYFTTLILEQANPSNGREQCRVVFELGPLLFLLPTVRFGLWLPGEGPFHCGPTSASRFVVQHCAHCISPQFLSIIGPLFEGTLRFENGGTLPSFGTCCGCGPCRIVGKFGHSEDAGESDRGSASSFPSGHPEGTPSL